MIVVKLHNAITVIVGTTFDLLHLDLLPGAQSLLRELQATSSQYRTTPRAGRRHVRAKANYGSHALRGTYIFCAT